MRVRSRRAGPRPLGVRRWIAADRRVSHTGPVYALVGDEVVAPGELVRREMNFGQPCPGAAEVPYRVRSATGGFVELFQPVYDAFLREARADAERFPEDWPELAALADAGFPPLPELPAVLPGPLAGLLREALPLELLDAVLSGWTPHRSGPATAPAPARYVANTVDHVSIDPAWLVVSGRALRPVRGT